MGLTTRSLIKTILFKPLKWLYLRHSNKKRQTKLKGLDLVIYPGVFDPRLFLSTRFMMSHIRGLTLKDLTVLDMGCGTGALALLAVQKKANVFAADINPQAIHNTLENSKINHLPLTALESDVWESITEVTIDLVMVNPPYYPAQPANMEEQAWYCGNDFEYFQKFFSGLDSHLAPDGQVLMVLSEDCDISTIKNIAQSYGFIMTMIVQKRIYWELNIIFSIQRANANQPPFPA